MRLALLALAWLLAAAAWTAPAVQAQQRGDDSIFRRFETGREPTLYRQMLFEVPVRAVPQTSPDAEIIANTGLNLNFGSRPLQRAYLSQGINFARLEWQPEQPDVNRVQVITWDVTAQLNVRLAGFMVLGMGLGVGFMDGVITYPDQRFDTRLEPYLPIHLALGVPLGRRFLLSFKVAQSSFFGPGPTISVTRGLVGFGYNY